MSNEQLTGSRANFDRINAILAGLVFLGAFIVYALTVQRNFSFWDCGEFIACSSILGIPHPPGTPLLIIMGRIFSMIPFVEDISLRINYMTVISSAFTAMFSYLVTVRIIRFFFTDDDNSSLITWITYIGGLIGGFFVAFSATNWANSVEAEAYGLALALSLIIFWLTLRFHEERGTPQAVRTLLLAMFLVVLGIGVHMTVFLVFPVCAIFFILKKEATSREYLMICVFAILELLLVLLFSMGGSEGGPALFKMISVVLAVVLFWKIYSKVSWGILIAIAATGTLMISFSLYLKALPVGLIILLALAWYSKKKGWSIQWKTALAIFVIGFIGFSVNFFSPIRSSLNPRIDMNNTSRDFRTFMNFLDRKQYGQQSMIDRMFIRRGAWANQFGRHANMGFWSYFEEQYSSGGTTFIPFLLLGLIGMVVAIYKRLEVGLPFVTMILLASFGLVLYMNFADGTHYNFATGDAYLEVRNRDYFFTPAFVFFGMAMGLGVAAILAGIKHQLANKPSIQKGGVMVASLLVFLPVISLAHNYHLNDRSENNLSYLYAKNILDTCEENSILFTSGDNDTYPVWCLQEVYNYRKDVKAVNLSLLNTDWYSVQMKNKFKVPISLTDEQMLWYPTTIQTQNGPREVNRPREAFNDRPRRQRTLLFPQPYEGGTLRVQDMLVDEIVLENKWKSSIYFTSAPYSTSPLRLREHAVQVGQLYKLEREPDSGLVNLEKTLELYMDGYSFEGMETPAVFRDQNASGVFLGVGMQTVRVFDDLVRRGEREKAEALMYRMIEIYPEFFQSYVNLASLFLADGDTTKTIDLYQKYHDLMVEFVESNKFSTYYVQDLGSVKVELGRLKRERLLVEDGIDLVRKAYNMNPNSNYSFRKLVAVLSQDGRYSDLQRLGDIFWQYGSNRGDPLLQRLKGITP